jgi:hypothetical protein
MKYGIQFAIVAFLLVMLAFSQRGWHFLLLWQAVSFGIVSLGYLYFGPRVYGKSERGCLSPMTQLVLLPVGGENALGQCGGLAGDNAHGRGRNG